MRTILWNHSPAPRVKAADLFAWGRGRGRGYCGGPGSNSSAYQMSTENSYMHGSDEWNSEKRNSRYGMERNYRDSSGYGNSESNFKKTKTAGEI